MDKVQIFRILGIEESKDEDIIKQAYRSKLVSVNPEEDPEGFKRLRAAYEEACVLAKQQEKEASEEEATPVNLWMREVRSVYECFSKRIEPDNWKPLLEAEVCSDLDTWLEAREALLAYVMEHFRMPSKVFAALDQRLNLVKDKDELYEQFPKEFVNFLVDQCGNDSWLNYSLFEGADDADFDGYIRAYFDLKEQVDEKKTEGLYNRLEEMEAFGIYHPYAELEKGRFYELQELCEEAGEIYSRLLLKYPEDNWVRFCMAEYDWKHQKTEIAVKLYRQILESEPAHYTARIRLARHALNQGEYVDAKERYTQLLREVNHYPEFLEGLKESNAHLITQYKKLAKEQPEDVVSRLKLGWCYLENEQYDLCVQLMESFYPDKENVCEYHSLRARTYFNAGRYPDAKEHFDAWLKAIKEDTPNTQEEKDEWNLRLAAANSFLCSTCQKLGDKDPIHYEAALEYVDEAYRQEPSVRYWHQKASLLLEIRRYQDCVDMCDKIVAEDSQYFPAFVIRQEAYYNLHASQEVIDDFYHALALYQHYPKMYQLAAQVFFIYRQYDDALNILKRAEDAQVSSRDLAYIKGEILWRVAGDNEERQKALDYLYQVENEWGKENVEPEELAKLICEEALCLMMMKDYEEALTQINRAINKDTSSTYYLYSKADILSRMGKYKEALKLFMQCERQTPEDDDVLEHIGDCHKNMDEREKAIDYYKKALERNPNNRRCNSKIVDIYDDILEDSEKLSDFKKALPYANRQLELTQEAYYYIERGLLYMAVSRWEEAIADFDKAAELEPMNTFAYNNKGCVYKYQEKYELAIEALQKALEVMDEAETPLPYGNLANCYQRMGQYEKAVDAYKKDLELFPKRPSLYDDLSQAYAQMKRYDAAIEILMKGRELPSANRHYFSRAVSVMYQAKGDIKNAIAFAQEAVKEDKSYGRAHGQLGDLYILDKDQPKAAVKHYKDALACYEETESGYQNGCVDLMYCYWVMGKPKEVEVYFQKAVTSLNKQHKTLENYLSSFTYLPARYYFVGRMFYYSGKVEKAKEYFDKMLQCDKCRTCSYSFCYEYHIAMALLEEAKGNKEAAIALYEKSMELDEGCSFQHHRISKLKEKRPFWR